MPAEVELTGDVRGVGDPPGRVQLVRHGCLAALVSEVARTGQLGTAADLRAHAQILDAAAAEVPVLPLRFGTVMTTKDAVAGDLLAVCKEAFAAALKEVEGRGEYVVKGRYVERAVLTEALAEIPEAARLRKQIRGKTLTPPGGRGSGWVRSSATRSPPSGRLTPRVLGDLVAPCCVASVVREPTHELDAVYVALLVEITRQGDLERVLTDLAADWAGRVGIRLLGPMAPYDFTPNPDIATC